MKALSSGSELRLTLPKGSTQTRPCIVCGCTTWLAHFQILARCTTCGFVRASEEPDEREIARLYEEDYFRGKEYGDYLADHYAHAVNFAYRYEQLIRISRDLGPVFEVGCAYGLWLAEVSRRGGRCAGVDICEAAVKHATQSLGQEATCEDFLEKPLAQGAFHSFCMWDTIEHLAYPERFIQRIFDLLPAGGWFFASTGDIDSLAARRRGPRWRMIHPPTHLQYFSQETMCRFLRHHGFEVVDVSSLPMYRSFYGTFTLLTTLGKGFARTVARVASRLVPTYIQKRLGFWLDLGDIMLVSARKPVGPN